MGFFVPVAVIGPYAQGCLTASFSGPPMCDTTLLAGRPVPSWTPRSVEGPATGRLCPRLLDYIKNSVAASTPSVVRLQLGRAKSSRLKRTLTSSTTSSARVWTRVTPLTS